MPDNGKPLRLKDLQATERLVCKHFDVSPLLAEAKGIESAYAIFKSKLSQRIRELMENHFEELMNILYRIDVNEVILKKTMSQNPPEEVPDQLAEVVIQRQIEKIRWRQWMSGNE